MGRLLPLPLQQVRLLPAPLEQFRREERSGLRELEQLRLSGLPEQQALQPAAPRQLAELL